MHRYELRIFDGLIDRAAVIQLPVLPLVDPKARAGSAAIIATSSPRLTSRNWSCAKRSERRSRSPASAAPSPASPWRTLAAQHEGRPFAGASLTEDYEMGLRIGALGLKTMFVRIPAPAGRGGRGLPAAAISRRRSARRSARRRAGSAESLSPDGTAWAGEAASASAGCGFATGAGRWRPCLLSRPISQPCCGARSGSPGCSARRSRCGSIRCWRHCSPSMPGCSRGAC